MNSTSDRPAVQVLTRHEMYGGRCYVELIRFICFSDLATRWLALGVPCASSFTPRYREVYCTLSLEARLDVPLATQVLVPHVGTGYIGAVLFLNNVLIVQEFVPASLR